MLLWYCWDFIVEKLDKDINKYNSKFSLKFVWNIFLVLIYDFLVLCWV